jgi:hypothetical protein
MKSAAQVSSRASHRVPSSRKTGRNGSVKNAPPPKGENHFKAVYLEKVRFGQEVLGLSEAKAKQMAALVVKTYKEVDPKFPLG